MSREEAEDLVALALALAMSRDGSSGGVIRCVAPLPLAAFGWRLMPATAASPCQLAGGTRSWRGTSRPAANHPAITWCHLLDPHLPSVLLSCCWRAPQRKKTTCCDRMRMHPQM